MTAPLVSQKVQETAVASGEPYRVMVVDDSSVVRGFITRYLEHDRDIKVVASASNGQMALNSILPSRAEVVVLDIEMPGMDGMTALPKLIEKAPGIKVVMASTLTRKNAEVSLKALQLGAVDYVPKPLTTREVNSNIDFRRELVEKVRVYAEAVRKARDEAPPAMRPPTPAAYARNPDMQPRRPLNYARSAKAGQIAVAPRREDLPKFTLRKPSTAKPAVLAIGASTGGPQALIKLLTQLRNHLHLPVVITQHMPATFTSILAEHIARAIGLPSCEGTDGVKLESGHVYVAPGDHHMMVEKKESGIFLKINQDPPENFCRPAVDPLFRSISDCFGKRSLAVVLTGMGHDGLRGARDVVQAGGTVIAQDQASSVVWGMPGAVATAGLCSAVPSLNDLPKILGRLIDGDRI